MRKSPMLDVAEIILDIKLHWMLYLAMPLVAAAIGYITKIVAIQMMFYPVEFMGIKPFLGWQGIVPRKAKTMAEIACDTLARDLLDPLEIWQKIDREKLLQHLEQPMLALVEQITHEVAMSYQPALWQALPKTSKQAVISRIQQEAPAAVHTMMDDIGQNIEKVFDIKAMIVHVLTRDKRVLIHLLQETGKKEFEFIRRSGIYFGFGIGIVQAITWACTHSPWIMPLFGGFVGYASDWLALKMVFRPVEPKKFFGVFTWQGLFLKRRLEVSDIHAKLLAEYVVTPKNLFEAALSGPAADRLYSLVHRHVQDAVDVQAGYMRPVMVFAMGSDGYQGLKHDITQKVMAHLPETIQLADPLMTDMLDMRQTLASKMRLMTAQQFENLLRPAFQQDEWILVLLGGVLGFAVGELQVHLMLSSM